VITIAAREEITGEIAVPGDKSISHRGLILAALSDGACEITHLGPGDDVAATRQILASLGADISTHGDAVRINGVGMAGLKAGPKVLNCGNSGTTARLLTGVLAAQPFTSVLDGDASLRTRPMERVIVPLSRMTAQIRGLQDDGHLPMEIRGRRLKGCHYDMPIASAQVKSAILLAGLFADGDTSVTEPLPSRDHTERLFDWLGLPLSKNKLTYTIRPGAIPAFDLAVPGDFSSAAYFVALGLMHPRAALTLTRVNLNPTRAAFLDLLRRMGAHIQLDVLEHRPELLGHITVRSSRLQNQEVDPGEIPAMIDELPLLAVVATQADGKLEIRGAGELRVKESDRISAIVSQLSTMGARITEYPDGFAVTGPTPLRGAHLDGGGDHRIVMALAIAAAIAEGPSQLAGEEWAAVSYPGFFQALAQLGTAE
jgi:3-phosphoshikimate 1-carboxyvinyltransferase